MNRLNIILLLANIVWSGLMAGASFEFYQRMNEPRILPQSDSITLSDGQQHGKFCDNWYAPLMWHPIGVVCYCKLSRVE
jgi:hypothetical protein